MATDNEGSSDSNDIAEIIGNYTFLEKHGDIYKGYCPFCSSIMDSVCDSGDERLVVRPELKEWHCFQCGAGGSAEDFVELYNTKVLHRSNDYQSGAPVAVTVGPAPSSPPAAEESEEHPPLADDAAVFGHYISRLREVKGYQAVVIFDGSMNILAFDTAVGSEIDFHRINELFMSIVDSARSLYTDEMTAIDSGATMDSEAGIVIYSSMQFKEEPVHVIVLGSERRQLHLMKLRVEQLKKY
jgi:hypothetical protein